MEKNSQEFSMQEAMRLAKSPAGQQLLAMLRQADSQQLQQAMTQVSSGDYTSAQTTIQSLLQNPEIQKMLQHFGG